MLIFFAQNYLFYSIYPLKTLFRLSFLVSNSCLEDITYFLRAITREGMLVLYGLENAQKGLIFLYGLENGQKELIFLFGLENGQKGFLFLYGLENGQKGLIFLYGLENGQKGLIFLYGLGNGHNSGRGCSFCKIKV